MGNFAKDANLLSIWLPPPHHHHLLSLPPPALRHQNRSSRTPPACSAIPSPASGEVVPQILNNHSSSPAAAAAAAAPAAAVVKKPYQQRNGVRWSQRRAAIVQIQEADDLRSALSSFQGQLQVQDLNTILRYFGESKRWNDVMQLFDWMQKCDNVNVASYSTFFKFMGKSHNLVKALQVYNDIGDECTRYNASVCNALLGCFVRHGKFETSMNLFEQMKKGGLTPDIVTYSTLLSGCTKIKDGYSKSLKLMEELKSNGLHMDSVIYGTVLAVCASNNLSKEAENFFQQMVVEGCEPNLFHYSSLLNAYSVDGDYAKAEKLVKDMKSSGIEPNKVILTTLLKVYVRGGLFEKSRELLVKLGTLGHAEEEMPFCILMDGLAKAGQIDEAKVIFQDMKMKGVKSDGYSHSIMISACCRHGLIEDAKQLAEEFEGNNYKYDLVMMNTLLRTYCQAGEMEHVMKVLRKMDELAISPDWNTFQILIKYFYKKKMYSLAFRTVEDMHKKGHQLDEELCSSLMIRLGKNGATSEAFSVYNMLRYSKRTISKALHEKMLNILVSGGLLKDAYVTMKDNIEYISSPSLERFLNSFMRSGNINLINDVLKACNKSSYRINQNVFSLAVSRYVAEPEKKELLLHLLQWMTGQGYCVDSSTRNHILKNSHLFGRQLIADILSKQFAMSRKLQTQKVPGS